MRYQNLEIHNVEELLEGDGTVVVPSPCPPAFAERNVSTAAFDAADANGLWITRLPDALRRTLNPAAKVTAVEATGGEIRFNLKSARARITLKCNGASGIAEIYQGCFLVAWQLVGPEPTEITITPPPYLDMLVQQTEQNRLPFDARLTRVVLPWRPPVRILAIEGEFDPPRRDQTPARRYLAYGSSITQGHSTIRPTGMYTQRTAQLVGVDLINLGFGGGAHLEPQMADYIAGRTDWDVATLETGINVNYVGAKKFAELVDYFIPTIARAHSDKWIFCTGIYPCRMDFLGEPWLDDYRAIVKARVESLNLPRLVHIDGRELMPSVTGLSADLVHPSPAGMEELACNLSTVMRKRMGMSED